MHSSSFTECSYTLQKVFAGFCNFRHLLKSLGSLSRIRLNLL